jgi:hypothetical protein
MKRDAVTSVLLSIIAISLIAIAVRPGIDPRPVKAQQGPENSLFIEPGTQLLRAPDGSKQVYGRVVVDLRTGMVWGFPTITQDTYPLDPTKGKAVTSHPFLLGRFAFEDMDKK